MLAVYLCPTQHCPQLLRLGAGAISRLARGGEAVRVFRPIVAEAAGDAVLDALAEVAGHDPTAAWGATAEELVVNPTAAVGQVISRYRACADEVGRVLTSRVSQRNQRTGDRGEALQDRLILADPGGSCRVNVNVVAVTGEAVQRS